MLPERHIRVPMPLSERHIRAELEASPSKIVLLVNSEHAANADEPSKFHSSFVPLPSGQPGFDHIAVAWLDQNGELQFGQMRQGSELVGYGERLGSDLFGSKNDPGSLGELLSDYKTVKAIPLDLSPYGQAVRDVFVNKLEEAFKPDKIYSFLENGHNCTSAVLWALGQAFKEIAPIGTGQVPLQEAFKLIESRLAGIDIDPDIHLQMATLKSGLATLGDVTVHTATPNDLYLLSIFLLAQGTGVATAGNNSDIVFRAAGDEVPLAFPVADVSAAIAHWAPLISGQKGASNIAQVEQVAWEALKLASDKSALTNDAASPKPATDGNQGASPSEQPAIASDNKNAPTDGAAVMETEKAEVGANPTVNDRAAATGQAAASTAVIPDDGFSFAEFAKQGVTVEAAKEAMPVEQPSPEASSSPGTPVSESATPDVGMRERGQRCADQGACRASRRSRPLINILTARMGVESAAWPSARGIAPGNLIRLTGWKRLPAAFPTAPYRNSSRPDG